MARQTQTNFTAADMPGAGKKGRTRKKSSTDRTKSPSTDSNNGVPEGSVDEVLEWVGNDKTKALAALDAENAKSNPRKTAIEELENLLTEDDDKTEEALASRQSE